MPNKKAFIFIPNKLIISTHLVKESTLNSILLRNPDFFSEEHCPDADFNILSLFVFWERLKGKESFFSPMFEVSDQNYSLMSWSEEELNDLEDNLIKGQVNEFKEDMESNWQRIEGIIKDNCEVFDFPDKNTDIRELYFWAYEFTMTRCYGWSLPSTILIPLADFLNHEKHGIDHYLVNKKYELDEKNKHPGYNIKGKKIDLTDFDELKETLSSEEIKSLQVYEKNKESYIEDYFEFLEYSNRESYILKKKEMDSNDLRNLIKKINIERLEAEKNRQIYHFNFFETSDEEDNDTGEEFKIL